MFIVNQKGKNNTESTVKYYKKVFRHLYRFLAYLVAESTDKCDTLFIRRHKNGLKADKEK